MDFKEIPTFKEINIKEEYIKLSAFLKFSGLCRSGGDAVVRIKKGDVLVNGEVCIQRGKKLYNGYIVKLEDKCFKVCGN